MRKKQFIAGIYNYCDRRCERCDSADRCLLHAEIEKADRRHRRRGEDPHDLDVAIEDAGRALERARRLIARRAKRMGIDLNEIAKQASRVPAADRSMIDEHPLAVEGMSYFKNGQKLVKAVGEDVDMTHEDIGRRSRFMGVKGEAERLAKVSEALDVLSWDVSLVAVKIQRALDGLFRNGEDGVNEDESHLQDARATAALVLRCLDRDKRALLAIYGWSQDHRDRALDLLAKTERIGRTLKQLLPASVQRFGSVRVSGSKGGRATT
jgi:hypothetical protein